MNLLSKLFTLTLIISSLSTKIYSRENDTIPPKEHIEKINNFIKRLRKKSPTSMHDFFSFFGENNELEIKLVRKYCEKDSIPFSDCVELSKKLYSNPFKYKSLTLEAVEESKFGKYIKKLHTEDSIQVLQDTIHLLPAHYIINAKEEYYIFKMKILNDNGNFISDILDEEKKSIFKF